MSSTISIIPYGRQEITQADIDAVTDALRSDFLTQGPRIAEFEAAFRDYVGARFAVAVANGTAALHLAAMALDVSQNQKVITTPITFAASANCIRYCGGAVDFVDIDPRTYTLDINAIRKRLESAPQNTYAGVVAVDFTGFPVDLETLRETADEFGLWIIEDACHAPGGYFVDRMGDAQYCGNGKFADMSVFSFHPVKHIAAGEGGMITTNNEALYEKLLLYRTHGITKDVQLMEENHGGWYYEMRELGYNYRLTDIQAALALSQLQRADGGMARRVEIAMRYDEAFAALNIRKQLKDNKYFNAFHLYVVEVEDRKGLYDHLRAQGIFAQVHYIPLHLMPYYRQFGWKKGDFPLSEAYYERCLSLPMYPSLTNAEQDFVIRQVKDFLA